jgi:sensor domain CHASE-containing protein
VKGTSSAVPQFFLTRNEHKKGMRSNPAWRLAMVTSALTGAPKIDVYEAKNLVKAFELEPYVFLGRFIPKSES